VKTGKKAARELRKCLAWGPGSKTGKVSAGLVMYRERRKKIEVLLAHPGGPYFAKKDKGYWTIPKGEVERREDLLKTAKREFREETGLKAKGPFDYLGTVVQKSGKLVHAWAFEGTGNPPSPPSCLFCRVEWPPRSGKTVRFPEIDRAEFFSLKKARKKIKVPQDKFIDRLEKLLTKN
jgi:predicted NUDIX family NTP pyrophosphohydrolase